MLPNGKKHACDQSAPLDLLSSLPENVIDDILICLPLRDAVRTSILSTKWRYKWCRIPQLNLDQTLWGTEKGMTLITKFTNIIYHLMTSHVGPISKFILSNYYLGDCPVIDNNCSIQFAPPAFKGFDRIISLELCSITISSKLLESLISNCPLLDKLGLHKNIHSGVIEINAPMLRAFDFTEGEGSISLKSVPRLVKLSLYYLDYYADIRNFFDSFCYLEHLEFEGELSLKLLSAAASEIGDSPELQCLKLEAFSDVKFNHLKKIKLRRTIGSDREMLLIKLLLAKSPMLQAIVIEALCYYKEAREKIRNKIPIVLNSFRRASPEVEVVYDFYVG
ncbi:hypothetical protein P3L10_031198 [Capsicum annuum]